MSSMQNNLVNPDHELRRYSALGRGELLSRLCRVRIEGRVMIEGMVMRNMGCAGGSRFRWKESGFGGRNQVSMEGIRFCIVAL